MQQQFQKSDNSAPIGTKLTPRQLQYLSKFIEQKLTEDQKDGEKSKEEMQKIIEHALNEFITKTEQEELEEKEEESKRDEIDEEQQHDQEEPEDKSQKIGLDETGSTPQANLEDKRPCDYEEDLKAIEAILIPNRQGKSFSVKRGSVSSLTDRDHERPRRGTTAKLTKKG